MMGLQKQVCISVVSTIALDVGHPEAKGECLKAVWSTFPPQKYAKGAGPLPDYGIVVGYLNTQIRHE